jgi:hypothetical protein
MKATAINPTKAPISSVRTRKTCSSRSLSREFQWRLGDLHQLVGVASGVSVILSVAFSAQIIRIVRRLEPVVCAFHRAPPDMEKRDLFQGAYGLSVAPRGCEIAQRFVAIADCPIRFAV